MRHSVDDDCVISIEWYSESLNHESKNWKFLVEQNETVISQIQYFRGVCSIDISASLSTYCRTHTKWRTLDLSHVWVNSQVTQNKCNVWVTNDKSKPKLKSWTQDMIIVNNFDFHRDPDRKYFSLSNFRTLIRVVNNESWAFLNRRLRRKFHICKL